jgi:hypothetical protein
MSLPPVPRGTTVSIRPLLPLSKLDACSSAGSDLFAVEREREKRL